MHRQGDDEMKRATSASVKRDLKPFIRTCGSERYILEDDARTITEQTLRTYSNVYCHSINSARAHKKFVEVYVRDTIPSELPWTPWNKIWVRMHIAERWGCDFAKENSKSKYSIVLEWYRFHLSWLVDDVTGNWLDHAAVGQFPVCLLRIGKTNLLFYETAPVCNTWHFCDVGNQPYGLSSAEKSLPATAADFSAPVGPCFDTWHRRGSEQRQTLDFDR